MRFLAIGDNCIDYYTELKKRFPGGNALNVAVYISKHEDVVADYVGVIGDDENGDYLIQQIENQNIDTKNIIRKKGATAVTKIVLEGGNRTFQDYLEGVQESTELTYDDIPNPKIYDLIHFTIWGFGREHIKTLKEETKAYLTCDFSNQLHDPRTEIMPNLDTSFFSGGHLIKQGINPENVIKKLKEKTPGLVIMTLGEKGSIVYDGENIFRGETIPVEVIDTLGAGDAFIAEFLYNKMRKKPIKQSIIAGHQAAKEVCKRFGAWGG